MKLNMIATDIEGFSELFSIIYKGDLHAMTMSMSLLHVLHTWDDLIDGDEVAAEDINLAFLFALTDVAGSPLWGAELAASMKGVYYRWQAANVIESDKRSSDNELAKAWMLRISFYDLFVVIAGNLHGRAWAETISPIVYKVYSETLVGFIKEMRDGWN